MQYKEFVVKRVPEDVKSRDKLAYTLLLSTIKSDSIRTTEQLSNHLNFKIDRHRRWLATNKSSSTMNKLRRNKVQELSYLMKIKTLLDSYLK